MQLFPILLIAVVLAGDGGLSAGSPRSAPAGWAAAAIACLPVALLLAALATGMRACGRRMTGRRPARAMVAADRMARGTRWVLLAHHAVAVLGFGWLAAVRGVMGDLVLVDELVTILPAVAGLIGTWWVYYPVERRLREALVHRRIDQGRAVFPTPSRLQYVVTQARVHLLFLLVPILVILTLAEIIDRAVSPWSDHAWHAWAADAGTFLAALAVVALAPVLALFVLDVEPLPRGRLQDELLSVCRAHGVKVRRLLLWKTQGTLVNAAVMGLVWPLRFVLLTDALLESMTPPQLQAVMAHEIGHIRRRHMPWMMAALVALVIVPVIAAEGALRVVGLAAPSVLQPLPPWAGLIWSCLGLGAALGAFGWISRRFERQADAFAAGHLSVPADAGRATITDDAVEAVVAALGTIARLDAISTARRSWRHGSIAWRQEYLASIVGRPADELPIDRQIRWIKGATAVLLSLSAAYLFAVAAGVIPQPVA